MSKKEIMTIILVLWLIGTTGYMIRDIWNEYKVQGIQKAYESAVLQVINEAEGNDCKPFSVYAGESKVELISTKCLQTAQEGNNLPEEELPKK